jgi:hypothetical protein
MQRRVATALTLVLLLAACRTSAPLPERRLFEFNSNFWLNMHHFLRVVARGYPVKADMTPTERAAWEKAVEVYRNDYAKRDLLFDEGMLAIKTALRSANGRASLEGVAIDPALRATMEEAAPIYRRYFWPEHDAANRSWIENATRLVGEHGARIAPRVAGAYGEPWPSEPVPVDLSVSAGASGAYTTHPPHSTIASMDDPQNRGLASLEIVFHEASHQWGRRLSKGIAEAAEQQGKQVPRGLWHAVLFYNAGEITRQVLAADGIDYVDYATRGDIYKDFCGSGCREKVEAAWDARLRGEATIEEALERLVASF